MHPSKSEIIIAMQDVVEIYNKLDGAGQDDQVGNLQNVITTLFILWIAAPSA